MSDNDRTYTRDGRELDDRLQATSAEIAKLRVEIAELRSEFGELTALLHHLVPEDEDPQTELSAGDLVERRHRAFAARVLNRSREDFDLEP